MASLDVKNIGVVGAGSMGGGMALLFADHGLQVSIKDPSEKMVKTVLQNAKEEGVEDRVHAYDGSPKVFVFSLPHGSVGDTVMEGMLPFLQKGDVILDAANEAYENSQRRQGKAATRGIRYVAVGVSGGYQAARRGPSFCPSSDEQSLQMVLPLLQKVAAKGPDGVPCAARCGLGGSGHYVKMLHNGIEHAMMSAISEAWKIMHKGLGMSSDEIGDVFVAWNSQGELKGTFLIEITSEICKRREDKVGAETGGDTHVLATVLDKVVQDVTGEEGTGVWSTMEAVRLHVPAPSLAAAHFLRLASAFRGDREAFQKALKGGFPPQPLKISGDKSAFIEQLRVAVYTACLAAYAQGMAVIDAANVENGWDIDYAAVRQIWRGGCIIQADYISEHILQPAVESWAARRKEGKPLPQDLGHLGLLFEPAAANGLASGQKALKAIVSAAIEADLVAPALAASLEYINYMSGTGAYTYDSADPGLPTSMTEAQLDFFGKHMYDTRSEHEQRPSEGHHHYEWRKP